MAKNYAQLVMSYIDCDTIPFFWSYAKNFTIFDHIFATEDTPSTPNAIAMIAGQAGETQWVKHGTDGKGYTAGENRGTTQGPPFVNDPQPFYGSQFDTTAANRQPAGSRDGYKNSNIASNMTFADRAAHHGRAQRGACDQQRLQRRFRPARHQAGTFPSSRRGAARRCLGDGTKRATPTNPPIGWASRRTTAT